jgi:arylsulfatase A-like enzyme
VLQKIRELGEEDNTLVMFLSDNGGSSEYFHVNPEAPPGPLEGFHTVDRPWANASNTPFRKYKTWDHEGGISTPFIAYWPDAIKPDTLNREPAHLIDLMPTCLDVADATYPEGYKGRKVLPMEGHSLVPLLKDDEFKREQPIFWQFQEHKAVRLGQWKLLRSGDNPWELYDMTVDRMELRDASGKHPDRVREMAAMWNAWANRVGIKT